MIEKEVIVQNLTYSDLRHYVVDYEYTIPIITTLNNDEKYVVFTNDICICNDTTFKPIQRSVHLHISDFVLVNNLIAAGVGSMDMCIIDMDLLKDKKYWHFIADTVCSFLSEDMLVKFFSYINHKTNIKLKNKNSETVRSKIMDINEIIKMQMMMKMMQSEKDFDISKMLIMQAMASGGEVNLSEVMKAKMLSSLMENGTDDIPAEKVALIKMIESGSFNISDYLMTKMSLSLLEDPDSFDENKLILMSMLDSSTDINDVIKLKICMKMFNSDTPKKDNAHD